MTGALYKLIDDVEALLSRISNSKTFQLTVKYDCGSGSTRDGGRLKRACRTNVRRRRVGVSPKLSSAKRNMIHTHARAANEDDDSACLKMIGNETALAYSSNLNNGFIGIQTADTVCPSASIGPNELRTSEDALEEHQ